MISDVSTCAARRPATEISRSGSSEDPCRVSHKPDAIKSKSVSTSSSALPLLNNSGDSSRLAPLELDM